MITFTKIFYNEVWKSGSKICKCFDWAIQQVKDKHGQVEADKFKLWRSAEHRVRDCQIYGNFQEGRATFKKERALLWDKIPPISSLVGYQKDR